MIANAGIFRDMPIVDVTVETWDTLMTVNARSVLLAIKHAARHMIAQGRGGRIIGEMITRPAVMCATEPGSLQAASSAAGKRGMTYNTTISLDKS